MPLAQGFLQAHAGLIADFMRPVQAQAGFTVMPNYSFADYPAMDAFLIPGGYGTRQEIYNRRLHEFIRSLPQATLLTSVCTGSWIYAKMGLLDGLPATNRKEPASWNTAKRMRFIGMTSCAHPCSIYARPRSSCAAGSTRRNQP